MNRRPSLRPGSNQLSCSFMPKKSPAGMRKPPPAEAAPAKTLPWRDIGLGGLLFCAVCIAYGPALQGGLLWDDVGHVTRPSLQSLHGLWRIWFDFGATQQYYPDRKSTRLNSSHLGISYAVFCLKKKK